MAGAGNWSVRLAGLTEPTAQNIALWVTVLGALLFFGFVFLQGPWQNFQIRRRQRKERESNPP